ncbi:MAG TPA: DNA polymerase IV [Xanthobacteraceae bacterium]|nr:DNA polymerase IV [Xanthobacteraceae bacterium]
MPGFCRDCLADVGTQARCPACHSPRLARHPELDTLSLAHVDCDAFYAAIEKRDDPTLADKPLIVGGGKRGVVTTACYLARTYGVRSAMPMFEAKRLCPHAAIVRPDFDKYSLASRQVRKLMLDLTPQVEPLSIDEAFMDLAGTERLHGMSAAKVLARFATRVERDIGITVSIGLSCNKFLAKIASDLDKPRGFAVLGGGEAAAFLAPKPVSLIYGVGKVTQARLAREGFRIIADLQRVEEKELVRRYGVEGQRLARLGRGLDDRTVNPERNRKSVSAETTFERDLSSFRPLEQRLWTLTEEVSERLKQDDLSGSTVTLKLKTADFRILTRARSLEDPTQLAGKIFATGRDLLAREINGTRYRLLGIGVSALSDASAADPVDLVDRGSERRAAAERAVDRVRGRFGHKSLIKGLALDESGDS